MLFSFPFLCLFVREKYIGNGWKNKRWRESKRKKAQEGKKWAFSALASLSALAFYRSLALCVCVWLATGPLKNKTFPLVQCVLRHRKIVVEREKKAAQLFRVSSSVFHSPIRWSLLLHPPLSRSLARSFHHILYFTAYTQCVYVYCLLTHGLIIPFSLSRFLSSARRQNGFQQCRCKVAFASVFFYIPFSLSLSVTGRENLFPKTSSTRQPTNQPPLWWERV